MSLFCFAVGELAAPSMSDFLWGLENSGWLKHIKAVLDAGVFIAKAIHFFKRFYIWFLKGHAPLSQVIRKENHGHFISNKTLSKTN